MIIQPIGDNIVVKLPIIEKPRETTTESGIVLMNNNATEQSLRQDIADVIATGEGRTLNNGTVLPLRVKAGDQVIYNKFAGTEVVVEDEKYLIIKECDILAITKS